MDDYEEETSRDYRPRHAQGVAAGPGYVYERRGRFLYRTKIRDRWVSLHSPEWDECATIYYLPSWDY